MSEEITKSLQCERQNSDLDEHGSKGAGGQGDITMAKVQELWDPPYTFSLIVWKH